MVGGWLAFINLGWVAGKRSRKSYYGETRREVQERLTKALCDIQKGLPVVSEKQTVGAYLGWWVETVAKPTVRPSTWTSYEELVRLHLRPAFEKVVLSKLSPQHVRSFLNERLASGFSTRRVQYLHAVLRAALNTAVKDQLVIRNVAAIIKPPRVIGKEVQPLTPEEARRFLDSIRGNRLEALFTVAISVGLRQGEALGLVGATSTSSQAPFGYGTRFSALNRTTPTRKVQEIAKYLQSGVGALRSTLWNQRPNKVAERLPSRS